MWENTTQFCLKKGVCIPEKWHNRWILNPEGSTYSFLTLPSRVSGSTQLKQREILWRKTQKRIKRNWKMALWSCPGPQRFKWTLFEMCQWNCRELLHVLRWKFRDLSLSRNFFDLDSYLSKQRVLRASKRNLEREILTTVDRDWIFFSSRSLRSK